MPGTRIFIPGGSFGPLPPPPFQSRLSKQGGGEAVRERKKPHWVLTSGGQEHYRLGRSYIRQPRPMGSQYHTEMLRPTQHPSL
jgi:hypothetical protein